MKISFENQLHNSERTGFYSEFTLGCSSMSLPTLTQLRLDSFVAGGLIYWD